jgi:hypothetical protein
MSRVYRIPVVEVDGFQQIHLPDEFQFEGVEVSTRRGERPGTWILSEIPRDEVGVSDRQKDDQHQPHHA